MKLTGTFAPPGDKSISHRLALMAVVAHGVIGIENYSPCADCLSSLEAVRRLGGKVTEEGSRAVIQGLAGQTSGEAEIDCGNSGTTIRMLTGLLSGIPGRFVLDGDPYLRRRPMERVAGPMRLMGATVETMNGRCPVTVNGGGLKGIEYALPVASAQLKSALIFAGLQADGQTVVREPVLSRDHTERLVATFGGTIRRDHGTISVERSALTYPESWRVPGDASSAAFFLCAAAILPGSEVTAEGVLLNPTRTGFIEVLKKMGADLSVEKQADEPEPVGRVTVRYSPDLTACDILPEEIPLLVDEVPILALTATQAKGRTVFRDVGELRVKETDRLAAVAGELGKMGADITVASDKGKDRLIVNGRTKLAASGELDSFGDHRMAMTLRLALLLTGGNGPIRDEACARVSYPTFHDDLKRLAQ